MKDFINIRGWIENYQKDIKSENSRSSCFREKKRKEHLLSPSLINEKAHTDIYAQIHTILNEQRATITQREFKI